MRLRTQLALLSGGAIAATGIAVAVLASLEQARALDRAAELRAETLARSLATRGERAQARPAALRALVTEWLWEEEGLLAVEVTAPDGAPLASKRFGREAEPYRVVYPIRDRSGEAAAFVSAELSRERVRRETARVWRGTLAIGAALILVGALAATLLARAVTSGLDRLAQAAARLAAGDRETPLAVAPGGDEVAQLGRAFEAMRVAVAEREARIAAQNEELRRLIEAREALTHMIAHDLKGPVGGVRGALEALAPGVPVGDRELIELARVRLDAALALCSDLLDVGRLEAGQLELRREPLDLEALCRAAVLACAAEAREAGALLEVRASEPAPRALADRALVERVVINLVINAIRHGVARAPKPEVVVACTPHDRGALVTVADSGPGIAPEERDRVFEMFAQGRQPGQPRRGAGVGLAFCKRVVTAHGGRIWIESEEGRGSKLCFTLPVDDS
jgi:signal transduction histidine kinase